LPRLQEYVQTITGHRSSNYINLNVSNALNWYILYDGAWIVGFSGINKLCDDVVRIMYRTYLAPEIRNTGLSIGRLNWKMSGHLQLKFCRDMNYQPVISRENNGKINAARNICKEANRTSDYDWRVLDGYYYTCNHDLKMKQSCWQKIIAFQELQTIELPYITDEQYKNIFQ